MKTTGLHTHRFRGNPEEKRFAKAWDTANRLGNMLDHLLDTRDVHIGSAPAANGRDHVVAATVIQWLGSPVGQSWLADLGYVRTHAHKPKVEPHPEVIVAKLDDLEAERARAWAKLRKLLLKK